jgi:hypothetical protein
LNNVSRGLIMTNLQDQGDIFDCIEDSNLTNFIACPADKNREGFSFRILTNSGCSKIRNVSLDETGKLLGIGHLVMACPKHWIVAS